MISSSWIRAIHYLGGVLQVELKDRILEYTRVPPWVKGLLLAGPSVGRRYNQLVRDRYPYRAIPKPENKQDIEAQLRASLEEGRNR